MNKVLQLPTPYTAPERAVRNEAAAIKLVASILRTTATASIPPGTLYSEREVLLALLEAVQLELGVTEQDLANYRSVRL